MSKKYYSGYFLFVLNNLAILPNLNVVRLYTLLYRAFFELVIKPYPRGALKPRD